MAVSGQPVDPSLDSFVELPDPGPAATLDDLVERLRLLKVWAGDPSYEWVKDRVNAAWSAAGRPPAELVGKTTVVDCFRPGRRRLNADLVVAVVRVLHPDVGYVTQWRQALQVIGGQTQAASQVRVQDRLPSDLDAFTGRTAELDRLRRAFQDTPGGISGNAPGGTSGNAPGGIPGGIPGNAPGDPSGGAMPVAAIAGMAGVGKTQLAVRVGHVLAEEAPFDRILFVNLRGFHPDAAQPPADPAAVLDGFLRLLGVPGHQVPHDLAARVAAYRARLAGTRTLVLLDNAADEDQVRPLLPDTPGCPVLITSRRSLTGLRTATHVTVDVFTPAEALAFLARTVPDVPVGHDPGATARIAGHCGHLPLALGLVTGHMRTKPGWTLTDHADRLDERHQDRQLDGGVQLALDLSYRHLPVDQQRLLRLVAQHPGQDFDVYAALALSADAPAAVRTHLDDLCRDHLLQQVADDRYTLHDLIRVYAIGRASDDDPPSQRRAALTRLFDYYLATTATVMDTLRPADTHRRPGIPPPATPTPTLTDPATARTWLDIERPTLVAVAAYTADHGWPTHTTRLSAILFRYLTDGHLTDALSVQDHARHAAHLTGDPASQAHALTDLGATHVRAGRYPRAAEYLQHALDLYAQISNPAGQARALTNLGLVEERLGRFRPAADHYEQALALHRQAGDRTGEARALGNLAIVESLLDRGELAAEHLRQALALSRQAGDQAGEASHLNNLGEVEGRLDRYGPAAGHLQQALTLYRRLANRAGEAGTLDSLGTLYTRLGQPVLAAEYYRQAIAIVREMGEPQSEACALNGLGEATNAAGQPREALAHHTAAHLIAIDIGDRLQRARAHAGLGRAQRCLGDRDQARQHYRYAMTLYTDLGMPQADEMRADLDAIDAGR